MHTCSALFIAVQSRRNCLSLYGLLFYLPLSAGAYGIDHLSGYARAIQAFWHLTVFNIIRTAFAVLKTAPLVCLAVQRLLSILLSRHVSNDASKRLIVAAFCVPASALYNSTDHILYFFFYVNFPLFSRSSTFVLYQSFRFRHPPCTFVLM